MAGCCDRKCRRQNSWNCAKTPREAVKGADIIISMVADDQAARAVWLGEDGALAGAKKSAVLVESSTITPEWIKEFHEAAAKKGTPLTGQQIAFAAQIEQARLRARGITVTASEAVQCVMKQAL